MKDARFYALWTTLSWGPGFRRIAVSILAVDPCRSNFPWPEVGDVTVLILLADS